MKILRSFVIGFEGFFWITKNPDESKVRMVVNPIADVKEEVVKNAKDVSKIIQTCMQQIKEKHPNIEDLKVVFILEV